MRMFWKIWHPVAMPMRLSGLRQNPQILPKSLILFPWKPGQVKKLGANGHYGWYNINMGNEEFHQSEPQCTALIEVRCSLLNCSILRSITTCSIWTPSRWAALFRGLIHFGYVLVAKVYGRHCFCRAPPNRGVLGLSESRSQSYWSPR